MRYDPGAERQSVKVAAAKACEIVGRVARYLKKHYLILSRCSSTVEQREWISHDRRLEAGRSRNSTRDAYFVDRTI